MMHHLVEDGCRHVQPDRRKSQGSRGELPLQTPVSRWSGSHRLPVAGIAVAKLKPMHERCSPATGVFGCGCDCPGRMRPLSSSPHCLTTPRNAANGPLVISHPRKRIGLAAVARGPIAEIGQSRRTLQPRIRCAIAVCGSCRGVGYATIIRNPSGSVPSRIVIPSSVYEYMALSYAHI